jgi:hypothetical protein
LGQVEQLLPREDAKGIRHERGEKIEFGAGQCDEDFVGRLKPSPRQVEQPALETKGPNLPFAQDLTCL